MRLFTLLFVYCLLEKIHFQLATCFIIQPSNSWTVWMSSAAITIIESDFQGAGVPRINLQPEEIPTLLMTALSQNDFPHVDAGLKSMWAFSSDTTRFIFQRNDTEFVDMAHQTAREFPTSLYGCAFHGQSWTMETSLYRVGGENDWSATQVMKTISRDGRSRRWQWELRKQRRPPFYWYVESVGSSDRNGQFEAE